MFIKENFIKGFKKLLCAYVMCACIVMYEYEYTCALVHLQNPEDNLRYWSSISTFLNLVTLIFDAVYQLASIGTSYCSFPSLCSVAEVTEIHYSTQLLYKFQAFKLKPSHLYDNWFFFIHLPISISSQKPFQFLGS